MIVVFDAECLLCSGWVKFLLRHDSRGVIKFAALQGKAGQRLLLTHGLQPQGLQTLLLVAGSRHWTHTAAIFRVLDALGWPWRLAWLGWLVPWFIRDPLYRWMARNRYRFFGQATACLVPSSELHGRFLD